MSELLKLGSARVELPGPDRSWKLESRPGGWILGERTLPDGSIERKRFALAEVRGRLSFHIDGRPYSGEVSSGASRRQSGAAGSGDSDLVAQFPGKVRKLLVREGQQVNEGDPLLLVEAMKMEFSVKAPASGRVAKIYVQEGQQLAPGTRFLDLENGNGKSGG